MATITATEASVDLLIDHSVSSGTLRSSDLADALCGEVDRLGCPICSSLNNPISMLPLRD